MIETLTSCLNNRNNYIFNLCYALVSVAITYSSIYDGEEVRLEHVSTSPSKNWSFACFSPADGLSGLTDAVAWMKQYAILLAEALFPISALVTNAFLRRPLGRTDES